MPLSFVSSANLPARALSSTTPSFQVPPTHRAAGPPNRGWPATSTDCSTHRAVGPHPRRTESVIERCRLPNDDTHYLRLCSIARPAGANLRHTPDERPGAGSNFLIPYLTD